MNNDAAIAYAVLAVKNLINQDILRTNEKDIYHILQANIYALVDTLTEDEAISKVSDVLGK